MSKIQYQNVGSIGTDAYLNELHNIFRPGFPVTWAIFLSENTQNVKKQGTTTA